MFVNVSPAVADTQESISSLRFATKVFFLMIYVLLFIPFFNFFFQVNACEIGVARRGGKIDLKLD